jgi:hypothetical protein
MTELTMVTMCFFFQFYDHFFDWGHKEEIEHLVSVRTRNGIHNESELRIMEADANLYLAEIDGKVIAMTIQPPP